MSESVTRAEFPGELTLQVHVASALSGNELLPWTSFPCADVISRVRRRLGCRPSRTVTLLHLGSIVKNERYFEAPGNALELTANFSDALSAEERDELVRKIISQTHPGQADERRVEEILMASEASSDDRIVVLTAVQKVGRVLRMAKELCHQDVLAMLYASKQIL